MRLFSLIQVAAESILANRMRTLLTMLGIIIGVAAVIVMVAVVAAAASSSDPVVLAAELCRDRGRVVVIGAVGMDVPRPLLYEKELSLRVSRSYGPGRYDPLYEEAGVDYPVGYVRWTENRNLLAFLDLVGTEKVSVEPLITHRVPIADGGRVRKVTDKG